MRAFGVGLLVRCGDFAECVELDSEQDRVLQVDRRQASRNVASGHAWIEENRQIQLGEARAWRLLVFRIFDIAAVGGFVAFFL